jgi:hypothetical protein
VDQVCDDFCIISGQTVCPLRDVFSARQPHERACRHESRSGLAGQHGCPPHTHSRTSPRRLLQVRHAFRFRARPAPPRTSSPLDRHVSRPARGSRGAELRGGRRPPRRCPSARGTLASRPRERVRAAAFVAVAAGREARARFFARRPRSSARPRRIDPDARASRLRANRRAVVSHASLSLPPRNAGTTPRLRRAATAASTAPASSTLHEPNSTRCPPLLSPR